MAADIIPLRSSRSELVRERAARIVDGTFLLMKVPHGRGGFDIDLSTMRCAFCSGEWPAQGFAYTFHDQYGTFLAIHVGCFREAPLWAGREYDPSEDDYPGGNAA